MVQKYAKKGGQNELKRGLKSSIKRGPKGYKKGVKRALRGVKTGDFASKWPKTGGFGRF